MKKNFFHEKINYYYKNYLLRTTEILYKKEVNTKVIICGNIVQVYSFDKSYLVNKEKLEIEKIENNLISKEKYVKDFEDSLNTIEYKNLLRSKNELIRLVNTNLDLFKSFLTLTFKEDIVDLNFANKEFDKFKTKIKRKFPNFLYIGVAEFQKNGRVHYHLLTNIDFNSCDLINENKFTSKLYQKYNESQINSFIYKNSEDVLKKKYKLNELNNLDYCFRLINGKWENTKCTYNKKSKEYKIFKTINYWNCGFSNIVPLDNIDIVGYISKYLTKDFDNRLYSHHRYFHSRELKTPKIEYLNLKDNNDIIKKFNIEKTRFSNTYYDKFGNKINFIEYELKK